MYNIKINVSEGKGTSVVRNIIMTKGQYEPEIVSLLLYLLESSSGKSFFVDVGSNIGLFPLIAAEYKKLSGKVLDIIAHEPLPQLQQTSLRLQIANNLFYSLDANAISDTSGTADFYVSAVSDSSNSLVSGFREIKEVITVSLGTIDSLYTERVTSNDYKNVILMIDVETAEPAVLRGAIGFLKRVRPVIICEVLANRSESEMQPLLKQLGYAFYRYDGEMWQLTNELKGDRTYKYRDWLFIPSERIDEFGANFIGKSASIVELVCE